MLRYPMFCAHALVNLWLQAVPVGFDDLVSTRPRLLVLEVVLILIVVVVPFQVHLDSLMAETLLSNLAVVDAAVPSDSLDFDRMRTHHFLLPEMEMDLHHSLLEHLTDVFVPIAVKVAELVVI